MRPKRPGAKLSIVPECLTVGMASPRPTPMARNRLLDESAMHTASKQEQKHGDDYLVFRLGSEEYAIAVGEVRELVHHQPAPTTSADDNARPAVRYRGRSLPAVDLRSRLSLGSDAFGRRAVAILLAHQGRLAGIIVDDVMEMARIAPELIIPSPALAMGGLYRGCLTGLAWFEGRLLVLIDAGRLLTAPECRHLATA